VSTHKRAQNNSLTQHTQERRLDSWEPLKSATLHARAEERQYGASWKSPTTADGPLRFCARRSAQGNLPLRGHAEVPRPHQLLQGQREHGYDAGGVNGNGGIIIHERELRGEKREPQEAGDHPGSDKKLVHHLFDGCAIWELALNHQDEGVDLDYVIWLV